MNLNNKITNLVCTAGAVLSIANGGCEKNDSENVRVEPSIESSNSSENRKNRFEKFEDITDFILESINEISNDTRKNILTIPQINDAVLITDESECPETKDPNAVLLIPAKAILITDSETGMILGQSAIYDPENYDCIIISLTNYCQQKIQQTMNQGELVNIPITFDPVNLSNRTLELSLPEYETLVLNEVLEPELFQKINMLRISALSIVSPGQKL